MSPDNGDRVGQDEPIPGADKSEAQVEQERRERFQKEPYSFLELKDIVTCTIKGDKSTIGVMTYVAPGVPRSLLNIAQVELDHVINKCRMQMDIAAQMKKAAGDKIIVPGQEKKHGITDFAKRFKG